MSPYRASFNDGKSAATYDVILRLLPEGLRIDDAAGRMLDLWTYQQLQAVDEGASARPFRLRARDDPHARLVIEDPRFLEDLIKQAPWFRPRTRALRRGFGRLALGAVGVAAVVSLFWIALPAVAGLGARLIPVPFEEALGEKTLYETLAVFEIQRGRELKICETGAGLAALSGLVGRLSEATDSPYEFKVIVVDLDETNAFALPGGYIVLFDGLIRFTDSPEEVAGVLAHEMGHVIHRHGTQSMFQQLGLSLIFDFLMGDVGGSWGGQLGGFVIAMSYSRDAEYEADDAGVRILKEAGIRPGGVSGFFRRLMEAEGDIAGDLQMLSTHPSLDSRLERLKSLEDSGAPAMTEEEWAAFKAICE